MQTTKTFLEADYAVLDRALATLGFGKTVTDEAVIYYHKPTDSIMVFPPAAPEEKVHPLNLMKVRSTVLNRGVASFEDYWNAFVKASGSRRRPAPKESA